MTDTPCIDCGEPAEPGWKVCQACDAEHRRSSEKEDGPTFDELDAFCAGEMGFKKVDAFDYRYHPAQTILVWESPEGKRIPDWQPSRKIAQAFMVLEKLPASDRVAWADALCRIISETNPDGATPWQYANATAHQRCLALWRIKHD